MSSDEWNELIWGPLLWQISLCWAEEGRDEEKKYLKRIFKLTHWVAMIVVACCPFKFNLRKVLEHTTKKRGQSGSLGRWDCHGRNPSKWSSSICSNFLLNQNIFFPVIRSLFYLSILIFSFPRPFAHPMSQNAIVIIILWRRRRRRERKKINIE